MNNVFKFSKASNIALHALAYLASDGETYVSASWLGKRLKVSEAHLSKVLNKLAAVGILISSRGSKGGFMLNVKPEDISLLDIIETVDGKLDYTGCFLGEPICGAQTCLFVELQRKMTDMVRSSLKRVSLAQFIKDTKFEEALKAA